MLEKFLLNCILFNNKELFSDLECRPGKARNSMETVVVTVRFITIMQRYSGQRELQMKVPKDPGQAIDLIISQFNIPWKDKLEKSSRIFINKQSFEKFIDNKHDLMTGDVIAFIPMSGGG